MDFEPCFKVYNLVSIRPKSMKLGQMTNLNVIFNMVGAVYRLVTIRNSPQFPVEFVYATCVAGCSLCKTEDKQVNLQANHSCLGVDRLIFVGVHG